MIIYVKLTPPPSFKSSGPVQKVFVAHHIHNDIVEKLDVKMLDYAPCFIRMNLDKACALIE